MALLITINQFSRVKLAMRRTIKNLGFSKTISFSRPPGLDGLGQKLDIVPFTSQFFAKICFTSRFIFRWEKQFYFILHPSNLCVSERIVDVVSRQTGKVIPYRHHSSKHVDGDKPPEKRTVFKIWNVFFSLVLPLSRKSSKNKLSHFLLFFLCAKSSDSKLIIPCRIILHV